MIATSICIERLARRGDVGAGKPLVPRYALAILDIGYPSNRIFVMEIASMMTPTARQGLSSVER